MTGVPLGTLIGQHFGWRESFLAVSLLGIIALVASQLLIPRNIAQPLATTFAQQARVMINPRLLLIYAITALGYGVSVAIGNIWGGKLADRRGAVPALTLFFMALAILLMVFQFTASMHFMSVATVLVMGIFAFANVPGLQVYVVQKAEHYAPDAVDVAPGLNTAAFNIGIVLSSTLGGYIVEHYGLAQTPWVGAVIVLGALLLLVRLSGQLDKTQTAIAME